VSAVLRTAITASVPVSVTAAAYHHALEHTVCANHTATTCAVTDAAAARRRLQLSRSYTVTTTLDPSDTAIITPIVVDPVTMHAVLGRAVPPPNVSAATVEAAVTIVTMGDGANGGGSTLSRLSAMPASLAASLGVTTAAINVAVAPTLTTPPLPPPAPPPSAIPPPPIPPPANSPSATPGVAADASGGSLMLIVAAGGGGALALLLTVLLGRRWARRRDAQVHPALSLRAVGGKSSSRAAGATYAGKE
jgi:hypothetical protein